ncbi:response regulator [Pedobacter petrophilus]|uniref:Response regulator n=1 Tax=Pedobacter petrophilus TaxID=1908241 RepID=A0A7K0FXS3_9SPHI|nr:response regulator [Pedobacter petrophilus]MRX75990.1 response regulator [Pedobacter petrophilus]
MAISCIAIDDDFHSLENLISYIDKFPELELRQTFTEPLLALSEISVAEPVDIIFIDIEMPSLSGIALAGLLRQKAEHLIFTTAHPRYALDAFKVEADAYLLKPYSILHFAKAINSLYPAGSTAHTIFPVFEDQFFYLPSPENGEDLMRIDLNDLVSIEHLENEINFITLHHSFSAPRINFAKMITLLKRNLAFIEISEHITIAKSHIISVLDDQILLSGERLYEVAADHKERFEQFVENNRLKD